MMSWLRWLWRPGATDKSSGEGESGEQLGHVHFFLPGWTEEEMQSGLRVWRDSQGAVLSCAELPARPWLAEELADETGSQCWARSIAEGRKAGLIERRVSLKERVPTVGLIYKRLEMPAYVFTGMLFMPCQQTCLQWTVVAGEQGTTGVREATVTAELMNSGDLTLDSYEQSWARDPYSAEYRGVERSALRFISDDERYDKQFPEHPLSKVRQTLKALPSSTRVDFRK